MIFDTQLNDYLDHNHPEYVSHDELFSEVERVKGELQQQPKSPIIQSVKSVESPKKEVLGVILDAGRFEDIKTEDNLEQSRIDLGMF